MINVDESVYTLRVVWILDMEERLHDEVAPLVTFGRVAAVVFLIKAVVLQQVDITALADCFSLPAFAVLDGLLLSRSPYILLAVLAGQTFDDGVLCIFILDKDGHRADILDLLCEVSRVVILINDL